MTDCLEKVQSNETAMKVNTFMAVSLSLIPSFCINLDRRADRWSEFGEESARVGFHAHRVSAVERAERPVIGLSGPDACLESHRKVWGMALSLQAPVVAVFEDDATFPSDFDEIFEEAFSELPKDWKIWHLHSFGPGQKFDMVGKYITRLKKAGWGSHGYLIKRDFAKELLDLSEHVRNMPVDVLLTSGMRYLGVNPYGVALEKTLCIQSANDSDIPESTQKKYWSTVKSLYMR